MAKRNISDVVLEMEQKLDTLLSYFRNMDNNIKLLLSRSAKNIVNTNPIPAQPSVSQAPKSIPPKPKPGPMKFEELPQTNIFDKLKVRAGVADDADLTTEHDELIEEAVHKGTRRGTRVETKPSGKVSVSQQVLNEEGGPVFLAQVEILDMSGALIKKTRTNTKGRWTAPLDPGQYAIHIVKRVQDKPPIDLRFVVEIPVSDKSLELDSPES